MQNQRIYKCQNQNLQIPIQELQMPNQRMYECQNQNLHIPIYNVNIQILKQRLPAYPASPTAWECLERTLGALGLSVVV